VDGERETLIPLHGFVQGDALGLLVLARGGQTIGELAQALQEAASVRVRPRPSVVVVHGGRVLDPGATVAELEMKPLDRFDVREGSSR
jgi:hypothetical protein